MTGQRAFSPRVRRRPSPLIVDRPSVHRAHLSPTPLPCPTHPFRPRPTPPTHPEHLDLVWSRLKAIMHPEALGRTSRLDPLTREIIALAVSATNGCAYCINSHTAAVRKLGLDVEGLGEVLAVVGLFNTTNALADGYQVEPDVFPPQEE